MERVQEMLQLAQLADSIMFWGIAGSLSLAFICFSCYHAVWAK